MPRNGTGRSRPTRSAERAAALLLAAVVQPVCASDAPDGRAVALDIDRGDCSICHALPGLDETMHGTVGPPLDGVGARLSAEQIRARIEDPKQLNPESVMPAYGVTEGLHRVAEEHRGEPILTSAEIDAVTEYLTSLKGGADP